MFRHKDAIRLGAAVVLAVALGLFLGYRTGWGDGFKQAATIRLDANLSKDGKARVYDGDGNLKCVGETADLGGDRGEAWTLRCGDALRETDRENDG